MSNVNMKKARELANKYGIECQLIQGASPKNCRLMLVAGREFKTTNWNSKVFEEVFKELSKGNIQGACDVAEGLSAAKSMLSQAYGRTNMERNMHYSQQDATYAKVFDNVQFLNRPLGDVLNQMYDLSICTSTEFEHWLIAMTEEGDDKLHADAWGVIRKMIKNKEVRILDGHVIATNRIKRFIEKWIQVNDLKPLNDEQIMIIIDSYCKSFEQINLSKLFIDSYKDLIINNCYKVLNNEDKKIVNMFVGGF